MSYKEKQVWAMMISGLVIMILYIKRGIEVYQSSGMMVFEEVDFWARTMLLYIGIGVVLVIVVMVVFHIVLAIALTISNKLGGNQGESLDLDHEFDDTEDEMDRLINLKAGQISYVIVGIGFVAGLITLAIGIAAGVMLNILYISFMLGSAIESSVKLYFYKRGIAHG